MTSLDIGVATIRSIRTAAGRFGEGWRRISRWANGIMPKGL
jgi:hypothetical protein